MKHQKLTIVARIVAKEEQRDLVLQELLKLIEPTRREAGCINYDLHQDNENPNLFLFYENWENRVLWQDHMNSPHLAAYKQATEDKLEAFEIYEMTPIG